MGFLKELKDKIIRKDLKICIIGLGYVGLPLCLGFIQKGFSVIGLDIDDKKIKTLNNGESYIKHINDKPIKEAINSKKFEVTVDFSKVAQADAIILCVPTPLYSHREPDTSYISTTMNNILPFIRKGQIISLESTTYPGTTEEFIETPLLEKNFSAGEDIFIVYSPEREDPGNKNFSTTTIPKVVGGKTKNCLEAGVELYNSLIAQVVPVSSLKTAEMTKLLENIYRAVNIGLVNELKIIADKMGIDIWEVIDAAKTKPFGFNAFYPGPGLGGHCIPIDPFYLTWKAREYDFNTKFIELAGEINTNMPYYVVQKTIDSLNQIGITTKNAKILILELSYKKDVDDLRESPSLKLMEIFTSKGLYTDYNDPYFDRIPRTRKYNFNKTSVELTSTNLSKYDCVVIATDHSSYDYNFIYKNSKLIIDTRNALKKIKGEKIVKV